jgi:hypothetical protein
LQGIEILPLQSGTVEEDFLPIFCTDETETPKPDELLYLKFLNLSPPYAMHS